MKLIAKNGPAAESELPVEISVEQSGEDVLVVAKQRQRERTVCRITSDGKVMRWCCGRPLRDMGFIQDEGGLVADADADRD